MVSESKHTGRRVCFMGMIYVVGIGLRYKTHFYCLAVEAGFYSDVVECLPLDPVAQVRFPPQAVGIFLHPVTFGGSVWVCGFCFGLQEGMFRNYSVIPSRFRDKSI